MRPASGLPEGARGIIAGMKITWLGHGTFLFRLSSGQVVLMDPWIDGNPAYPKAYKMERVDTICITHGHYDHIHDAIPLAQRFSSEVVAIYETCNWLQSKGVGQPPPDEQGRLADSGRGDRDHDPRGCTAARDSG